VPELGMPGYVRGYRVTSILTADPCVVAKQTYQLSRTSQTTVQRTVSNRVPNASGASAKGTFSRACVTFATRKPPEIYLVLRAGAVIHHPANA
jgi:hypothetical protein